MQPYKNPVCGFDYLQHLYALAAYIKIYKYTGKAHLVFFLTLFFLLPPTTETICSVAVVNSQNSTDLFLLEGGYFRTFVIIFNPIGTVPIWATNHSQRSPFFVKLGSTVAALVSSFVTIRCNFVRVSLHNRTLLLEQNFYCRWIYTVITFGCLRRRLLPSSSA